MAIAAQLGFPAATPQASPGMQAGRQKAHMPIKEQSSSAFKMQNRGMTVVDGRTVAGITRAAQTRIAKGQDPDQAMQDAAQQMTRYRRLPSSSLEAVRNRTAQAKLQGRTPKQ